MSTTTENRGGARAPLVELSEAEQRRYSLRRAVAVAAGLEPVGSFEAEVSEEIARQLPQTYHRRGGLFIPTVFSRAALDAHTAGKGAELIAEQAGAFIPALRKRALVLRRPPHHGPARKRRLPPPGHGGHGRVGGRQPGRGLRREQHDLESGADAAEAPGEFDELQPSTLGAVNAFGRRDRGRGHGTVKRRRLRPGGRPRLRSR